MSFKSIMILGILAASAFSQSKSAVQFYDTTGQTKTGKVGWTGDAATGHFFIQVPGSGDLIKSQTDGISVNGTVTATKFSGDGSTLTNLPAPAASTVGSVTGLQDSLNKKANSSDISTLQSQIGAKSDTSWVKTRIGTSADTTWVNGKLSTKANTSDVTALQGQVGAKADSTSVNTKLGTKANTSDVTALQTTVSGKADTTWVKGKIGIKADTTWVKTQITSSGAGQIADGSVTTVKIADKAVTDAKIDSVSFGKLKGISPYSLTNHIHLAFDSLTLGALKTTGNIGIGTINPSYALDINGGVIRSKSNGTTGGALLLTNSGGASVTFENSSATSRQLTISTDAAALTIDHTGNVGIGTTSPLNPLDIVANAGGGALGLRMRAANNHSFLQFLSNDASETIAEIYCNRTAANTGSLHFTTNNGNPIATRMTISAAGNIGIGTTSPGAKLEVYETTGSSILRVSRASGGTVVDITASNGDVGFIGTYSSDPLAIMTNNSECIRINTNGNVGFGTQAPNDKIEISGAPGSNQLRFTNTTNSRYSFLGHDVNGAFWELADASDAIQIRNATNGIIIDCANNGNVSIPGNLCAGTTTCPSDRRFKTDIAPIDSSLSKVLKLQGVYYNWDRAKWPKKNFTEGKQIGLIAQEVEKIVPEVVNTDKEGYKSLSYDKLTAVLIEAVKEQQKEIETLKSENSIKDKKITDQQQSIIKQEDRLAKVEKTVRQISENSRK